jgi:GR25 family glycosyltransferase involved in LPS biosynthesis
MKILLLILIIVLLVIFLYRLTYTEPYEDLENIIPKFTQLDRFEDIRNILYINLDERTDRREQAEKEFKRVGLNAQRVQAVKRKPGALGCTLSHIKCLEMAKEKDWDHVMVCEDDILFAKDTDLVKKQFNTVLNRHKDWDVIALGVAITKGKYIDDSTARLEEAWCTTCYIVRKEYYDVLLYNFNISAKRLRKNIYNSGIDYIWQSLQKRDYWLTVLPILVIQHATNSDIDTEKNIESHQLQMINYFKSNIKNYPKSEQKLNHINLFQLS